MAQQGHGPLALPIQVVQDLPIGVEQAQLAKGRLVLHVALDFAIEESGPGAAGEQGLLAGAGLQQRVHGGVGLQALQGADGREDDEKVAGLVPRQGVCGAHPHGLELLFFVGHGVLIGGHASNQKRHIKAPG